MSELTKKTKAEAADDINRILEAEQKAKELLTKKSKQNDSSK